MSRVEPQDENCDLILGNLRAPNAVKGKEGEKRVALHGVWLPEVDSCCCMAATRHAKKKAKKRNARTTRFSEPAARLEI